MYRTHGVGADGIGGRCPGNTKVCDLYLAVRRNNDVLGLDIPVHDISVMSSFQSHCHLNGDAGCLFYSQFSFFGDVFF